MSKFDYILSAGQPIWASTPPAPVLVTVPNVPLCATGIEYPLSSGPATFTTEDLIDAVTCQDDPAVHAPRLKIGHIDPRFNGPEFDGTPAYGKFVNLHLSADRQVLVADAVGVPAWLAAVLPIAYPNRSIEGNMGVQTVTGHEWRLVIWRVALLGVVSPGVSVLEDLPFQYGEEMPEGVMLIDPETGEEVEAMGKVTASGGRRNPSTVEAAINADDVRRSYYESLEASQMWWWIRSMYLDPNELIVDDDEGGLYRVPFDVSGEEVTFQEAQAVKIQYVNASKKDGKSQPVALVASAGRQIVTYDERTASRPDATDNQNNQEVDPVGIDIAALRTRLGLSEEDLPDDATEEQINAALAGTTGDDDDDNDGTPPDDQTATDGNSTTDGGAATTTPPPVAAGMIQVPADQWAAMQKGLQAATTLSEEDKIKKRDEKIAAAIGKGKIRPADRTSMKNLHASNPEGFDRLLTASVEQGGLAENLYPVSERGASPAQDTTGGDLTAANGGYDESWLSPAEKARVDAIKAGAHTPGAVHVEKGA